MKRKAPMLISLALLVTGVTAYTDITVKSEVAVKAIAPKRYVYVAPENVQSEIPQQDYIKFQDRFSMDWGAEDAEILKKIAMAEAEGESTEGKALVMLVVLNRMLSDKFPDSIAEVVFQKNQFSSVFDGGRYWTTVPDHDCEKALQLIEHGYDESEGALYFESVNDQSWHSENLEFLFREGNHRFYK